MSEVARKRHRPHARVRAREIDDLEPAAVDAAVVDHDDLDAEPLLALDAIGHGRELALQQRQALLLVEERDDERDELRHQGCGSGSLIERPLRVPRWRRPCTDCRRSVGGPFGSRIDAGA